MSRPELQAPPEIFYDDTEARKYTSSSRIMEIQAQLSERALELLALPDDDVPRLLLDIGCGSGLSGETLSENGHQWIGLDILESMLRDPRHLKESWYFIPLNQQKGLQRGSVMNPINTMQFHRRKIYDIQMSFSFRTTWQSSIWTELDKEYKGEKGCCN